VWLRFRFNLSLRDIPDLMAARGIVLSHQTVKDWCDTFGEAYAKEIRRRRPRPGDKVAPRVGGRVAADPAW
jgi:putative transposase